MPIKTTPKKMVPGFPWRWWIIKQHILITSGICFNKIGWPSWYKCPKHFKTAVCSSKSSRRGSFWINTGNTWIKKKKSLVKFFKKGNIFALGRSKWPVNIFNVFHTKEKISKIFLQKLNDSFCQSFCFW